MPKYTVGCKSCGREDRWEADGYFDAADKMPKGWGYDRVLKGYVCPDCKVD